VSAVFVIVDQLVACNKQIDTTRPALEADLCVVLPPHILDMRRQHVSISAPMTRSVGADLVVNDH
jgi:hypothetical protein